MPALGCKCMNVILHISSLKPCSEDPGMSDAILTLDGIQHQLEFLVDERRPSSPPGWTDYACKVVPVTSVIGSASDESVGKEDLDELDKLAGSIRSELKLASQERIEEMIRIEKAKLDKSLKEVCLNPKSKN
eukprot:sb/3475001/